MHEKLQKAKDHKTQVEEEHLVMLPLTSYNFGNFLEDSVHLCVKKERIKFSSWGWINGLTLSGSSLLIHIYIHRSNFSLALHDPTSFDGSLNTANFL